MLKTYSTLFDNSLTYLRRKFLDCEKSYGNTSRLKNFYSIFFYSFSMMFPTIWQEFSFWLSKVLCEHQSIEKFLHEFFFQLRVRAHGGVQLKICFSTIKDLQIWFFENNVLFRSQKSDGYKTLWYTFRAIFGYKLKLLQIYSNLRTK